MEAGVDYTPLINDCHQHKRQLYVTYDRCPSITTNIDGWKLRKTILMGGSRVSKAQINMFEGDSVIVPYELDAKSRDGKNVLVWPIVVRNDSNCETKCLRVGFLVKTSSDTFKYTGFEDTHPVLKAGESHTYVLTAVLSDCSGVIVIDTYDLIYDNSMRASSVSAKAKWDDKHDCGAKYWLHDEHLDYHELIEHNSKREVRNAVYTMGENIQDGQIVINRACITQGDNVAARDETRIQFNQASIILSCGHEQDENSLEWWVKQNTNELGNGIVEYTVHVDNSICKTGGKIHLEPTIHVNAVPLYKRQFKLIVYGICDKSDHKEILYTECIYLGGKSCGACGDMDDDCHCHRGEQNWSCAQKITVNALIDVDKPITSIIISLSAQRVVYNINDCKVSREDDSYHKCGINDTIIDCTWRNDKCRIDAALEIDKGRDVHYEVYNKGTFTSITSLTKWLCGDKSKSTRTKKILKWALRFYSHSRHHNNIITKNIIKIYSRSCTATHSVTNCLEPQYRRKQDQNCTPCIDSVCEDVYKSEYSPRKNDKCDDKYSDDDNDKTSSDLRFSESRQYKPSVVTVAPKIMGSRNGSNTIAYSGEKVYAIGSVDIQHSRKSDGNSNSGSRAPIFLY